MNKVIGTFALGFVFSSLLSGCGPADDGLPRTVEASGVVTLDGTPVEGASIVFVDASGVYYASGASDSGGKFSVSQYESKSGAVPGEYMVQVSKTVDVKGPATPAGKAPSEEAEHAGDAAGALWKNDLPQKYASIGTSGLKVTVPDDGITDIKIELVSK